MKYLIKAIEFANGEPCPIAGQYVKTFDFAAPAFGHSPLGSAREHWFGMAEQSVLACLVASCPVPSRWSGHVGSSRRATRRGSFVYALLRFTELVHARSDAGTARPKRRQMIC